MNDSVDIYVLDDSVEFSLTEICSACGLTEQIVVEIVEEGIVEPRGARGAWRFTGFALTRIQRVVRLQREFDVNLPGAALALELLEEIARLRRVRGEPSEP
jgi:chaperone modulatory protein CbpM